MVACSVCPAISVCVTKAYWLSGAMNLMVYIFKKSNYVDFLL